LPSFSSLHARLRDLLEEWARGENNNWQSSDEGRTKTMPVIFPPHGTGEVSLYHDISLEHHRTLWLSDFSVEG
jgi:hypothetical protein